MSTISSLTHNLIDYAGLFPPANEDMSTVVAAYAKYLEGPNRDKLARLIIPASRLAEFENEAAELLPTAATGQPWRISALVPVNDENSSDFRFAISGISQFNSRHVKPADGLVIVDVIEIKTPTAQHIKRTMADVPESLGTFMEIPHEEDPVDLIQLISSGKPQRFFAKIRTGGITADLIPPGNQVARFIHACAENLVAFKATAGLHHPLRNEFNLTYATDSPRGTMYGFVNVFVAACFAMAHSITPREIEAILEITSADEIRIGADTLQWNGKQISARKVNRLRQEFALSFGSCSFIEPTTELVELGFEKKEQGIESAV